MSSVTQLKQPSVAEQMMLLFPTSTRCHATYNPDPNTFVEGNGKIVPKYRTVFAPVTLQIWERHLAGTYPLVASLACDDGFTKVSVVDIDDYFTDHIALVAKIQKHGLPLHVRQSKSGGAHVFAFHDVPIPIAESVKVSRGISRLLGFADDVSNIEYFPRVQKPDKNPVPLNMPFRGNDDRGEFIKSTGAHYTVEEFLRHAMRSLLTADQRAAIIKTKEHKEAKPASADAGHKFAEGKLRRYVNELKNVTSHKNNLLTKHAYHMGMMVANGWIEREKIKRAFEEAIVHWSDQSQHLETLNRTLHDGEKLPHPDLTDEETITEDGVALEFADRHADDLRYDCDIGKWYQWCGSHWRRTNKPVAFTYARDLTRELSKDQKQRVRTITSRANFAGNVERFAKGDWVLATEQSAWDSDPYLLGTPGGVVELRTGKLREAQPGDYITKITAVGPSENADCPRWLKFLDEATQGDRELVSFLQVLFGYALVGVTIEHLFVFIHGGGGNGKGVFLNTIGDLLGDYAVEAAPDMFTESKWDRHPTELAELRGPRLVTSSETQKGRAWNETLIKKLTGGDKIKGRFMRQDFFEFVPQFQPVIVGNDPPKLRDVSEAMKRRLVMVPFTHKPKVKDTKLREKLRAEWPGILRWLINGCLLWQAEGITLPKIVQADTDEYFEEQDVFHQWVQFQLVRTKSEAARMSDTTLFSMWENYATQVGEEPGDKRWFNQKLRGHPYNLESKKSNGVNYFVGIKSQTVPVQAEMDITGGGEI